MSLPSKIAIDGPAASGKTTLGKKLAEFLGYLFLDTGVMYRAVTWVVLQRGVDPQDEPAVTALAERTEIDVRQPSVLDGRNNDVLADGEDISWAIRSSEVEANVSKISAYPGVRKALTALQRRIVQRGRVVMVGRDIGTVVIPDADLKIYLDASAEERARRRYSELCQRGEQADMEAILSAMRRRDAIDSTRALAPLRPAEDAIILNSDQLDADAVFQRAKDLVLSGNSEHASHD